MIGAAVLAAAAMIVLPLALESEPKQSLSNVQIQIPKRASLDQGRAWLESRVSDISPAELGSPTELTANAVTRVDLPGPSAQSEGESAAVAQPEADDRKAAGPAKPSKADGERSAAALAAAAAASAREAGASAPADGSDRSAVKANAGKPAAGQAAGTDANDRAKKTAEANAAAAERASQRSRQAAAETKPPPMPERRKDRNAVQAASPSGYVVQIGAFSSLKGARTQMERARKLGFDAYTETISTRSGDRIRVRVGPYLTRDQANVARARLRSEGVDTVLIAP
ncbi:MAG: SPOR domain-containing protein [Burkholderiaceae bacterium]